MDKMKSSASNEGLGMSVLGVYFYLATLPTALKLDHSRVGQFCNSATPRPDCCQKLGGDRIRRVGYPVPIFISF
jgi:hypothetical protein